MPVPSRPWSAQVPAITDPGIRASVTEIAALMDARKDRIGEHAAEHPLPCPGTINRRMQIRSICISAGYVGARESQGYARNSITF